MKKWKDVSIRVKVLIPIVLMLVMMVCYLLGTIAGFGQMHKDVVKLAEENTTLMERAGITDKPWFLLDSKILADMDGAIFQDRVKLIVRSVLDDNNDNNLWKGRGRFAAGFADWRFVAVGGMTGGSSL